MKRISQTVSDQIFTHFGARIAVSCHQAPFDYVSGLDVICGTLRKSNLNNRRILLLFEGDLESVRPDR